MDVLRPGRSRPCTSPRCFSDVTSHETSIDSATLAQLPHFHIHFCLSLRFPLSSLSSLLSSLPTVLPGDFSGALLPRSVNVSQTYLTSCLSVPVSYSCRSPRTPGMPFNRHDPALGHAHSAATTTTSTSSARQRVSAAIPSRSTPPSGTDIVVLSPSDGLEVQVDSPSPSRAPMSRDTLTSPRVTSSEDGFISSPGRSTMGAVGSLDLMSPSQNQGLASHGTCCLGAGPLADNDLSIGRPSKSRAPRHASPRHIGMVALQTSAQGETRPTSVRDIVKPESPL